MEQNYIDIDLQKRKRHVKEEVYCLCFIKIDFRIDHIAIRIRYEVGFLSLLLVMSEQCTRIVKIQTPYYPIIFPKHTSVKSLLYNL